jgi:hypothetical protein
VKDEPPESMSRKVTGHLSLFHDFLSQQAKKTFRVQTGIYVDGNDAFLLSILDREKNEGNLKAVPRL